MPPEPSQALPFHDADTYALYASGELGTEYFQGKPWLRRYARWLKPTTFDDLMALFMPWETSDYRHVRLAEYIRRRLGKDKDAEPIPELFPFLADACGLLIYQEQAVQILYEIGGCPLDKATGSIRAIHAWGVRQVLEVTDFVAGASSRGYSRKTIGNIIALINARQDFLVKKSWCASQAFISYQAVYLKAHGVQCKSAGG